MILTKEQRREVARRIENWSRWYWGGGRGGGASPFPAYNLVNTLSLRAASHSIPIMVGEAEDADRIMHGMQPELVKALIIGYLSRGTPKSLARRCRCLTVRTYQRRVERASSVFLRLCFPRQPDESSRQIRLAA